MQSRHLSSTLFVCLGGVSLAITVWLQLRPAEAQTTETAVTAGQFEMAYAQLYDKDACETVMFHTATGQAWQRFGLAWKKIADPVPLPVGRYHVELVPSRQDGYRSFRINRLTGQSWYIKYGKWSLFDALEK